MYTRNIGILIAYLLGSYYNYITSSIFFIGITVVFLAIFLFVPSTPQYLLQKNNLEVRRITGDSICLGSRQYHKSLYIWYRLVFDCRQLKKRSSSITNIKNKSIPNTVQSILNDFKRLRKTLNHTQKSHGKISVRILNFSMSVLKKTIILLVLIFPLQKTHGMAWCKASYFLC